MQGGNQLWFLAWFHSTPMQSQLCPGLSPGGWLGSQTRHSLRSHFAVFPAASRSLILFSGHPCRHALHLSRGERGGESARLPVLYPQAVCCHRCQFSLALRLGSSFALGNHLFALMSQILTLGFLCVKCRFSFFLVFFHLAASG